MTVNNWTTSSAKTPEITMESISMAVAELEIGMDLNAFLGDHWREHQQAHALLRGESIILAGTEAVLPAMPDRVIVIRSNYLGKRDIYIVKNFVR